MKANSDTPAPLSADSLRDRLYTDLENSFMSFLRSDPTRTTTVPATLAAQQFQYRIEALIATALQSERQRIADSLPEKKTLETDLPLNAWEDDARFCAECGQFEYDGVLDCKCVGFNECLAAVRAVLTAEGSRLTSKGEQT